MKTFKQFALVAAMVIMGVSLTSCGGYSNSKAKDMIVKNNDGKLEEADYAKMIEWLDDYYQSYSDEWQDILEDNTDEIDYKFAKQEMDAEFASEYVFISNINSIVRSNSYDEKKVGKENKEAWEKLQAKAAEREKALSEKERKILK